MFEIVQANVLYSNCTASPPSGICIPASDTKFSTRKHVGPLHHCFPNASILEPLLTDTVLPRNPPYCNTAHPPLPRHNSFSLSPPEGGLLTGAHLTIPASRNFHTPKGELTLPHIPIPSLIMPFSFSTRLCTWHLSDHALVPKDAIDRRFENFPHRDLRWRVPSSS